MSESSQIESDENEAEAAFETGDGGEEDPSNMSLDKLMDDLDEAGPEFETIPEVDEKFQGKEPEDEEDTSVLEDENADASSFSNSQPAQDTSGGDLENIHAISPSNENVSPHSLVTSRQDSLFSSPVLKVNAAEAPQDDSTGPAETGSKKDLKGESQKRPSAATADIAQPSEWIYRAAAPVIRNPSSSEKTARVIAGRRVDDYAKPNSSRRRSIRDLCFVSSTNPYGVEPVMWEVNPAASVPMRAPSWKAGGKRKSRPVTLKECEERENAMKERRDCDLATSLGYETRVGNLVHINIPGARDLNRSWKHFLNQDAMSWGFPYWKGSAEKPQEPAPPPYLVHELKEKIWKHPRNRSFKTAK